MTESVKSASDRTPAPDGWQEKYAKRQQLAVQLLQRNKDRLLDILAAAGVTHVIVSFDGYGDSGQIENIFVRADGKDVPLPDATMEFSQINWNEPTADHATVTIDAAVENLAYEVLDQTHCGWENGDGAYGDITFDVARRSITLDHHERYTATLFYSDSF